MRQNRIKLLIYLLIAFFLGILVSGTLSSILISKAITKIEKGNAFANDFFHPQYTSALQSYQEAKKLWPFLKYNHSFTASLTNFKIKLQNKTSVIIYIKDKTKYTYIEQFTQLLKTMQGVKEVRYVSQEDALRKYREVNKDNPLLLEVVTADVFPASIEVYLTDQTAINKIITFAESYTFVNRVLTSP